MAKSNKPRRANPQPSSPTATATVDPQTPERRASDRRHGGEDRRAFWRPTPDRRREATELGRRADDT